MNKVLLIIDDDDKLRQTLAHGLRNAEFDVLTAPSAGCAEQILNRISVDAIILDRMMTGTDGLTFLKKLRASGNNTPTIMLTAMGGAENAIEGLKNGANDYLDKPFQLQELILRIKNMLRYNPEPLPTNVDGILFTNDEFFITDNTGTPRILQLSGEEKKLLKSLTTPIGNIVSAQPMVAKRLRGKINNVSLGMDIITIRGRGYKLVCPNQDRTQGGQTCD
ncbi:MAG: response regulator transcription factor [Alphaproteobacteria bacterium]|nr:response regulator transcription factor [Alphaproteobacteria bacterium]